MNKRVTIKDVAKHAGVSFKTVSRVVNKETSVQHKYKIKVLASIDKLGYQVDMAARNLRSTRSFSIGLVYDQPVAPVQNGVLKACQEQGYFLQIQPCDPSHPDIAKRLCLIVQQSRLAGLVLTPPISEMESVTETLKQNDIPFVSIISAEKTPEINFPCIFINDHKAGYDITNHIIGLGHRKIAFLWGNENHKSSQERFLGYQEALRDHTIELPDAFVVKGEYTFESGRQRALSLLSMEGRPTAIIGSNDEIASGIIIAARIKGLDVPKDVSVAGFEDSPFSRSSWPSITTAKQPTEEISEQATLLLIKYLSNDKDNKGIKIKGYTPQLIVRNSTGVLS